MMADGTMCHGDARVCNPHLYDTTRAVRETAGRAYIQALNASRAAGEPLDELRDDARGIASAARQVLA